MSRPTAALLAAALLVLGAHGTAIAQDADTETVPMWSASTAKAASDVAAVGDGFVLVGGTSKPRAAKVWTSDDGQDWSKVDAGDAFTGGMMLRAESFGDGVAVLGQEGRRLVSWHSPDGVDWFRDSVDRAPKGMHLYPYGFTDGPAGLLAVASLIGQDLAGQRFYSSDDGRQWQQLDVPMTDENAFVVSLDADDRGYVAVARPDFVQDAELYWTSSDGVDWQPFDGPADGLLHAIAIGTDGTYVAVGQTLGEGPRSAIWRADELGTWELVHTSASSKVTEELLDVVAATPSGFIAGGVTSSCPQQGSRYCPSAAILVSTDGREWTQLDVADGVPGPLHQTRIRHAASNGDLTVILTAPEGRPNEVWTLDPANE